MFAEFEYEKWEAHWRLVIAAPDMLKALEALFGSDVERCMLMDGKDDQIKALTLARAALAKAKGE